MSSPNILHRGYAGRGRGYHDAPPPQYSRGSYNNRRTSAPSSLEHPLPVLEAIRADRRRHESAEVDTLTAEVIRLDTELSKLKMECSLNHGSPDTVNTLRAQVSELQSEIRAKEAEKKENETRMSGELDSMVVHCQGDAHRAKKRERQLRDQIAALAAQLQRVTQDEPGDAGAKHSSTVDALCRSLAEEGRTPGHDTDDEAGGKLDPPNPATFGQVKLEERLEDDSRPRIVLSGGGQSIPAHNTPLVDRLNPGSLASHLNRSVENHPDHSTDTNIHPNESPDIIIPDNLQDLELSLTQAETNKAVQLMLRTLLTKTVQIRDRKVRDLSTFEKCVLAKYKSGYKDWFLVMVRAPPSKFEIDLWLKWARDCNWDYHRINPAATAMVEGRVDVQEVRYFMHSRSNRPQSHGGFPKIGTARAVWDINSAIIWASPGQYEVLCSDSSELIAMPYAPHQHVLKFIDWELKDYASFYRSIGVSFGMANDFFKTARKLLRAYQSCPPQVPNPDIMMDRFNFDKITADMLSLGVDWPMLNPNLPRWFPHRDTDDAIPRETGMDPIPAVSQPASPARVSPAPASLMEVDYEPSECDDEVSLG
ncbi:hypothetical protein C8J56DRAFT_1068686 [Mycena floridula]|nr:hypothetical protein C8J56DRAFT_1068686 [Mycena floridula]